MRACVLICDLNAHTHTKRSTRTKTITYQEGSSKRQEPAPQTCCAKINLTLQHTHTRSFKHTHTYTDTRCQTRAAIEKKMTKIGAENAKGAKGRKELFVLKCELQSVRDVDVRVFGCVWGYTQTRR